MVLKINIQKLKAAGQLLYVPKWAEGDWKCEFCMYVDGTLSGALHRNQEIIY